jgi:hypothetical protein
MRPAARRGRILLARPFPGMDFGCYNVRIAYRFKGDDWIFISGMKRGDLAAGLINRAHQGLIEFSAMV